MQRQVEEMERLERLMERLEDPELANSMTPDDLAFLEAHGVDPYAKYNRPGSAQTAASPASQTTEPPAAQTGTSGLGEYTGFGGQTSTEGFKYLTLEDGTVRITDYTGTAAELVIPARIDGKTVSAVGDVMGFNLPACTSVVIEDGPTALADYAFSGMTGLLRVTLPSTLKTVGPDAFSGCVSLRSVAIPAGVAVLPENVFFGCAALTEVTLPEGLTEIGEAAFQGCRALKAITVPDSVTAIAAKAFRFCASLTDVRLGANLRTLGESAFEYCESLTRLTLPASLEEIGPAAVGCMAVEAEDGTVLYVVDENVVLVVSRGSAGQMYCQDTGVAYELAD